MSSGHLSSPPLPYACALAGEKRSIVAYLRDEAANGRGWLHGRVRGWHLAKELTAAVGFFLPDPLQQLVRHGWVEARDIRRPGSGRPVYLYRVSARGWGPPGEAGSDPFVAPDPDEREPVLFPSALRWEALRVLQEATGRMRGPLRFGVRGWLAAGEIQKRVKGGKLHTDDLRAWEISGAVQVRRERPTTSGTPRQWYYRATPEGERVRLLLDPGSGTADPNRLVQLLWPPADERPGAPAAATVSRASELAPIVEDVREFVRASIRGSSLRYTAQQIGVTPTTLGHFRNGGAVYGRTQQRLLAWYVKALADESEPLTAARAARLLSLLLHPLDAGAGTTVRANALGVLADLFEAHGSPLPPWLVGLRTGDRA